MQAPTALGGREGAVYQQQIDELQDLAADPTLQSCCQRDLHEQIRIAETKAKLAPQDRSEARNRMASQVIRSHLDSEEQQVPEEETAQLDALREMRMKQLQAEARSRQMLQSEGHGEVSTVLERKLEITINESTAQHVICHITCEGDPAGEVVDEQLETIARRFIGTRFLRCAVHPHSTVPLKYGLELPSGIVCFFNGDVVGVLPLQHGTAEAEEEEEDEDVDNDAGGERIEMWLQRRKCLVSMTEALAIAGGDKGARIELSKEQGDDESDWQEPCEECGRRYPHQHIRSVYRGQQEDSESDE